MPHQPFTALLSHFNAHSLSDSLPEQGQAEWVRIAQQQPSPEGKLRLLSELAHAGFDAHRYHQQALTYLLDSLRQENTRLRQRLTPSSQETLMS
jgi:hypothetical protein